MSASALHTPERGHDETQAQYRRRQAMSRSHVEQMTRGFLQPAPPPSEYRKRRRAAVHAIGIRQFKKNIHALRAAITMAAGSAT